MKPSGPFFPLAAPPGRAAPPSYQVQPPQPPQLQQQQGPQHVYHPIPLHPPFVGQNLPTFTSQNHQQYLQNSTFPPMNGQPGSQLLHQNSVPNLNLPPPPGLPGLAPPLNSTALSSSGQAASPPTSYQYQFSSPQPLRPDQQPQILTSQDSNVPDRTDKEEGELSEGEVVRDAPKIKPPSGPRNPGQRRDIGGGSAHRQQPSSKANDRRKGTASSTRALPPSKKRDAASMGNSNFVTTAGAERASERPLSAATRKGPAVDPNTFPETDGITLGYLAQERAKAKAFILAWHRSGLTYDQMVAEDLDAQILKGIYDELGLEITTTSLSKGNGLPSDLQSIEKRSEVVSQNMSEAKRSDLLTKPDVSKIPGMAVPNKPNSLPAKPIYTNHLDVPQPQLPSDTKSKAAPETNQNSQNSQQQQQQQPTAQSAQLAQPAQSKPPAAVDRQSYIARLMAAKSKKSSSEQDVIPAAATAEVKEPEKASSSMRTATPTQIYPTSGATQSTKTSNVAVLPSVSAIRSDSPLAELAATAKRKAQTELARKRMEALNSARLKASQNSAIPAQSLPERAPRGSPKLDQQKELDKGPFMVEETKGQEQKRKPSPIVEQTDSLFGLHSTGQPEKSQEPTPASDEAQTLVQENGRIPGLFMTAPPFGRISDTPAVSKSSEGSSGNASPFPSFAFRAAPANVRKRPVASDFNDDTQFYPIVKRPFGDVRGTEEDEAMIIEASDDEAAPGDDTVAQHSNAGEAFSAAASTPIQTHQSLASQDQEANMNASVKRKDLDPRDKDYLKHQKDILAMKLKIAKLEQKRKAKTQSSRADTPSTPKSEVPADSGDSPHLGDRIAEISSTASASIETRGHKSVLAAGQNLHGAVNGRVNQIWSAPPPTSASSVSAQASSIDPQIKPSESEDWKNRRRTEIQSGIPALEASFADDTRQLEELKIQMRRIEEDMRRKQEDKDRLIQELESLGIDTDGMAHAALQATKDELAAQMNEAAEINKLSAPSQLAVPSGLSETSSRDSSESRMSISSEEDSSSIADQHDHQQPNESAVKTNSASFNNRQVGEETQPSIDQSDDTSTTPITDAFGEVNNSVSEEKIHAARSNTGSTRESVFDQSSQAQGLQIPSPLPFSLKEPSNEQLDQDMSDGEILESSPGESMDQSEDGSNSHMCGEEEEFSPPDTTIDSNPEPNLGNDDADGDDEYEPTDAEVFDSPQPHRELSSGEILSDDSGAYEPLANSARKHATNLESEGSRDEYDPDEDYVPPPSSSSSLRNVARQKHDESFDEAAYQRAEGTTRSPHVADLATEPQREIPLRNGANPYADNVATDIPEEDRFTPYKSALTNFKAFRFHPDFANLVKGGFRSATYTHNIDPQLPLCPFEAAGGICNDEKCNGQHLRSMHLNDDDMVRQVGMSNPGETPEEKSKFTEGLRGVLLDLKQRNINDPESVASGIAAYRRRFLRDPSRVL